MHSTFCDGKNTPEEMVLAAIEKGLKRMGICAHSPVAFDSEYYLPEHRFGEFQAEISRLREKYKESIEVLCGIELDIFSPVDTSGFDYIIGSVHYIQKDGEYFSVDDTPEKLAHGCSRLFGGDYLALARRYFEIAAQLVEKTNCDIIGHFDLLTIFNKGGCLLDESAEEYSSAWKAAVDRLLPFGKPFEINTGGIARGYRSVPYPAPQIMDYIASRGGKFVLSSDAHATENIAYGFDKYEHWCE